MLDPGWHANASGAGKPDALEKIPARGIFALRRSSAADTTNFTTIWRSVAKLENMPINIPLGFRFAGIHAGIKKNPAQRRPDADPLPRWGGGGRRVHEEPGVRRAGGARSRADAVGGYSRRGRQLGQRQRLHRRARAVATPARWPAGGRGGGGQGPQALVMSTGVIGRFLPMDKIAAGAIRSGRQLGRGRDRVSRPPPAAC